MNSTVIDNPVYAEIIAERNRQDAKWGEQNHPSLDPILTGRNGGASPQRLCEEYEIPSEARAKFKCNEAAEKRVLSWAHIAVEELSEAVSAIDDKTRRGELIQLAAVIVEWIQSIDRQNKKDGTK